jgi:hypothetical protein
MMKHFTLVEQELKQVMSEGKATQDDVSKAADLAKRSGRLEHIALYSQVKKSIPESE